MLPSPAWKTLTIRRSYFCADLADAPQDVRQLGPRHDAVLRAVAGAEPADRAERLLAALPQLQPLLGVVGQADFAGAVLRGRSRRSRSRCASSPASRPSTSMSSTAPASSGKPKWNAASTATRMPWSIISSAAGTMPAPMMSLMAFVASSTDSKTPSIVRYALRVAREPDPDLGDDAERALRCRRSRRSGRSPGESSAGPPSCTISAVGQ